ncbi:MAG: hypothetical protein WDZ85_01590 [Candidatus Paceibacterota bacterium]
MTEVFRLKKHPLLKEKVNRLLFKKYGDSQTRTKKEVVDLIIDLTSEAWSEYLKGSELKPAKSRQSA